MSLAYRLSTAYNYLKSSLGFLPELPKNIRNYVVGRELIESINRGPVSRRINYVELLGLSFLGIGCAGVDPELVKYLTAELNAPPYSPFSSKQVDSTQKPPPTKVVFNLGEITEEPSAADALYVFAPVSAMHDFVYRTREVKESLEILCQKGGLERALKDSGITANNYSVATLLYSAVCRQKELVMYQNEIAQNPHAPHPQIVISTSLDKLTPTHIDALVKNLASQLDGKIPYTLEDGTKGYYKAEFYVDEWLSPGAKRVLLKIGDAIIVFIIVAPAAGLGPFHHKSKSGPVAPAAIEVESPDILLGPVCPPTCG